MVGEGLKTLIYIAFLDKDFSGSGLFSYKKRNRGSGPFLGDKEHKIGSSFFVYLLFGKMSSLSPKVLSLFPKLQTLNLCAYSQINGSHYNLSLFRVDERT